MYVVSQISIGSPSLTRIHIAVIPMLLDAASYFFYLLRKSRHPRKISARALGTNISRCLFTPECSIRKHCNRTQVPRPSFLVFRQNYRVSPQDSLYVNTDGRFGYTSLSENAGGLILRVASAECCSNLIYCISKIEPQFSVNLPVCIRASIPVNAPPESSSVVASGTPQTLPLHRADSAHSAPRDKGIPAHSPSDGW